MSGETQLDILVFNSVGNTGVPSFLDHIGMFARHSKHRCFYHNFVYQFDPDMDFSRFDVVVFTHNFWLPALTEAQRTAIRNIKALKVLFLQDEFQYLRTINDAMAEMGIELMFTCVAENDFDRFYPKKKIPSLRGVHQNLTGYVTEEFRKPGLRARGRRQWDVGYRGRPPLYYMGLLGQHKTRIADEFIPLCEAHGLSHNISYLEEDRLSGSGWIDFLRTTRVQLGSPSGTSIVDLDGSLIEAEQKYRADHPYSTFEEVHAKILAPHEGKMVIETVSPRHFEYAATGATMALVEGDYGGYLKAGEHYIPIAPDYSNLEEVARKIKDRQLCREIADRAHAHLIASGEFDAEHFVKRFDRIVESHVSTRHVGNAPDPDEFNARMADEFDQALFFSRDGYHLIPSNTGKKVRQDIRNNALLTGTPVLGAMLRKEGGDPLTKTAKARAALKIASCVPEFRNLLMVWARNPEQRDLQDLRLSEVLKSLLLLGLIKGAQSGLAPNGEAFNVTATRDADGLTLCGTSATPGVNAVEDPSMMQLLDDCLADWSVVGDEARQTTIRLDLSARWPMKLFGNGTLFAWRVGERLVYFRSTPDEYFHLKALGKIASFAPADAIAALRAAVTAADSRQREIIASAFGTS